MERGRRETTRRGGMYRLFPEFEDINPRPSFSFPSSFSNLFPFFFYSLLLLFLLLVIFLEHIYIYISTYKRERESPVNAPSTVMDRERNFIHSLFLFIYLFFLLSCGSSEQESCHGQQQCNSSTWGDLRSQAEHTANVYW